MNETILSFLNRVKDNNGQADMGELNSWIEHFLQKEFEKKLSVSEKKQHQLLTKLFKNPAPAQMGMCEIEGDEYPYLIAPYYIVQLEKHVVSSEFKRFAISSDAFHRYINIINTPTSFDYTLSYSDVCASLKVQKQTRRKKDIPLLLWLKNEDCVFNLELIKPCMELLKCTNAKIKVVNVPMTQTYSVNILLLENESNLRAVCISCKVAGEHMRSNKSYWLTVE